MHGSARDLHGISRSQSFLDHAQLTAAYDATQFLHHGFRNSRPTRPKVHHLAHTSCVADSSQMKAQIETRKQIVLKQRFGYPSGTGTGRTLVADPWQEHFNPGFLLEL